MSTSRCTARLALPKQYPRRGRRKTRPTQSPSRCPENLRRPEWSCSRPRPARRTPRTPIAPRWRCSYCQNCRRFRNTAGRSNRTESRRPRRTTARCRRTARRRSRAAPWSRTRSTRLPDSARPSPRRTFPSRPRHRSPAALPSLRLPRRSLRSRTRRRPPALTRPMRRQPHPGLRSNPIPTHQAPTRLRCRWSPLDSSHRGRRPPPLSVRRSLRPVRCPNRCWSRSTRRRSTSFRFRMAIRRERRRLRPRPAQTHRTQRRVRGRTPQRREWTTVSTPCSLAPLKVWPPPLGSVAKVTRGSRNKDARVPRATPFYRFPNLARLIASRRGHPVRSRFFQR